MLKLIAGAVALGMLIALLPGCAAPARAPVPPCEDFQVQMVPTPQGPVFILDADGLRAIGETFRRLQHGECRIPALDKGII